MVTVSLAPPPPPGQQLGTVVPSTSDDTAEDQDPHDYDEVPLEEGAGQRRSMGRPQSLADQEKPDLRHRKLHDYSEIDVLPSSVPDRRSVPMPLPFEASRPGAGPKGVGSLPPTPIDEREEEDTVSRAKFDLVKERLKQVTVRVCMYEFVCVCVCVCCVCMCVYLCV